MSTFLVAIHLIVDTNGPNPRAEVTAALEAQLDRPATPVPAECSILDWVVAGEDLAASMAPVTIPSDYRPGITHFPQWPRVVPKRGQNKSSAKSYAKVERNMNRLGSRMCGLRSLWIGTVRH